MQQRLSKSHDRWLAGVCGGLAEHFGWSPGGTRTAFALCSVLSGGVPGALAYVILALLMPPPPRRFRLEDFRQQ